MVVRDRKWIMDTIKSHIGDDTSDASISLLEDMTDTLDDFESKMAGDGEDWKSKYEENDKQWREKYTARFFDSETQEQGEQMEQRQVPQKREFADLFKPVEN